MVAEAPDNDLSNDLKRFAAHAAVSEQASAFLSQLTTTAAWYATVTGATWVVVTGNNLGLRNSILLWLLGLHAVLSFGLTLGVWGLANNLIQRLNFAQWLGSVYWPTVGRYGGSEVAWRGTPSREWSQVKDIPGIDPKNYVQEFDEWLPDNRVIIDWIKARKEILWLVILSANSKAYGHMRDNIYRPLKKLSFILRYRAFTWPSLRFQRLWALMPAAGMIASIVLFCDIRGDGPDKKRLCDEAASILLRFNLDQAQRVGFDHARYIFDKAGCDVMRIEVLRQRSLSKTT